MGNAVERPKNPADQAIHDLPGNGHRLATPEWKERENGKAVVILRAEEKPTATGRRRGNEEKLTEKGVTMITVTP